MGSRRREDIHCTRVQVVGVRRTKCKLEIHLRVTSEEGGPMRHITELIKC
jgi:hypothetical protein